MLTKRIAICFICLTFLFCGLKAANAETGLDSLRELRHSPLAIAKETGKMLVEGNTDQEVIFVNLLIKCCGMPVLAPFAAAPYNKQFVNNPLFDLLNLINLFETRIPYELSSNKELTDETRNYVSELIYTRNLFNPDCPEAYKKYFYLYHLLFAHIEKSSYYSLDSADYKQKYFNSASLFYDAFMHSYSLLLGFKDPIQGNFEKLFTDIMTDEKELSVLDYALFYFTVKRPFGEYMRKSDFQAKADFTKKALELMDHDILSYWLSAPAGSWSEIAKEAVDKYSFEDNYEFMPQPVGVVYLLNYKYGSKENVPAIDITQGTEQEIFYKKILSLRYKVTDFMQGKPGGGAYADIYDLIIEILSSPFVDEAIAYHVCIIMNELNESLPNKSQQVMNLYFSANNFKIDMSPTLSVSEVLEVAKEAKNLNSIK